MERVVGKIVKIDRFELEGLIQTLNLKDGKDHLNSAKLKSVVTIFCCNDFLLFERPIAVGKIRMKLET